MDGTGKPKNMVECNSDPALPRLLIQRQMGAVKAGAINYMNEMIERVGKKFQFTKLRPWTQLSFVPPQDAPLETSAVYGLNNFKERPQLVLSSHSDAIVRIHDSRMLLVPQSTPRIHTDCVNGTVSIDSNLFGSFSDDKTVLIWDLRNMEAPLKKCTGHEDWIKNVHVMHDGKTLISSGCDYTIRAYDLNCPDTDLTSSPLLMHPGLTRTSIHPTEKTLYFSSWRTCVFSISNFNLETLEFDVLKYKLELEKWIRCKKLRPPFSGCSRNQLSIVHYVPYHGLFSGQSMDVHPLGTCCAVRYSRSEDHMIHVPRKEWVAVYDLKPSKPLPPVTSRDERPFGQWLEASNWEFLDSKQRFKIWKRFEADAESDILRHADVTELRLHSLYSQWIDDSSEVVTGVKPQDLKTTRYYIESNEYAPGIIKELSFSPCGRLLLSPTQNGFQILAYDKNLSNYVVNCDKQPPTAQLLTSISEVKIGPGENCVCAVFANGGSTIVCGTLEGKIIWHEVRED